MNGVLGMTEVLLLEPAAAAVREQLLTIQRSGRTMVSLIDDLLDVSKVEAGKLSLEVADFGIERVIADVQSLFSPAAARKGLTLRVVRGPEVPDRLRGDGFRLGQVLANLVSNAVKFTAAGEVRLEVQRARPASGLCLAFSVSDTGPGIPPEVLPRLFTAFQQGDASRTRRHGGTGLGLALSQELVMLMGGRIEAASTVGQGTRFGFEVCFAEARTLASDPGLVTRSPLVGRGPVLVVDDNPVNLTVAMRLVEKAGFLADAAVNGRAAVEAVRQGAYCLVLMDCHMPEMDGFEATERIRALGGPLARTPVVALTASGMPEERAACHRAGMNGVLVKPLTFSALCEVLSAHAA
jgi:CheY-like chemotaxis protein